MTMRSFVVLLCLVINGCSIVQESDLQQQHQSASERFTNLQELDKKPHRVNFKKQLYVPPLQKNTADLPAWSAQPITISAQGLTVGTLLTQALEPHGVVPYFDNEKLSQQQIHMQFSGSLAELLQRVASRYRWHLEWRDELLLVHEFEVAEFDVAFIAGDTSYFLGSRDQQQQGQSATSEFTQANVVSSKSEQYLNFSSDKLSVWMDLEHALRMLLSEQGRLTVNQSSTSVLVRDYPHHVSQVRNYLKQQNERLTRQVAIDVQIIEVTFNDAQQFAIDWDAIVRTAGGEGVLGFASAQLSTLSGGQVVWQQQQGKAAGSQLLIDALQQQGLVQISNHPRVVSLNNQIARIVLEDNATYLAAAGSAATANVGRADVLQPGVVTTGFELYLLPSIRANEVILQLSTELSDLERIDEVRSGTQMIQTPHTNRKKFFMKALVAHDQTLLMSGLKNERHSTLQQNSWWSTLLGGRDEQQRRHSETLVLLTPHIISREVQ
ncbi:hypothetical protein LG272_10155 [Pseudidiomarina marina]|uniref:hypothetical protein n=1 Tax=Pseudidiomarina marina TaxID=502366 RepID=UPI00384C01F4